MGNTNPSFTKILGIDFETANQFRSSACSVGLCLLDFHSGEILEKKCIYISPVPGFFDPFNIMIHGITPEMVADAPEFSGVLPEIQTMIDTNTIVVAHNAAFDMGVLRSACEWLKLPLPDMHILCTRVLSRVMLPGLASYTLTDVAEKCNLPEFPHHAADADAESCARILHHFIHAVDPCTVDGLLEHTHVHMGLISAGTYTSCHRKKTAYHYDHRAELEAFAQTVDLSECEDSPFLNAVCVFTGKLQSMVRKEAEKLVIKNGGIIGDKITSDTNFLICGYQDPRVLKGKAKSRKLEKAEKLAADGQDIQILNEDEFFKMI